jgi:hypothetical protein
VAWTLRDYTSRQDLRDDLVAMAGGVLVPQDGTGSGMPQSRHVVLDHRHQMGRNRNATTARVGRGRDDDELAVDAHHSPANLQPRGPQVDVAEAQLVSWPKRIPHQAASSASNW